ncbi:MAG: WbqC family protein [Candidatus Aminicenantes bacterium]|nr:WbqC family protein [Candidatus Aminicenantes bacterium]
MSFEHDLIVSVHQPQYLPWLGYFDKIEKSDIFVFLDNVQFKKNEWQNRNRIKTVQGWQWLTVPVLHKFPQKINEVKINNTAAWGKKHLNSMVTHYSKSPFFKEYFPFFEKTYSRDWNYMVDINIHIIKFMVRALGISSTQFLMSSEIKTREDSTKRLLDICRDLKAKIYLSGRNGARYMDETLFHKEGIEVIYQDYHHPEYPQLYGEFVPYISAVDLLFNCGPKSLSILKNGE